MMFDVVTTNIENRIKIVCKILRIDIYLYFFFKYINIKMN